MNGGRNLELENQNENATETKENAQPVNQAAEQGAEARPAEGTSTRRRRKPSSSRSGKSRDGQAKAAQDGQAEVKKAPAVKKEASGKESAKKEPARKDAAKKDAGKKESAAKREPAKETRPAAKSQNQNQNRPAKAKSAPKGDGKGKLKIIPLGGLEQIGMNITAFEYEDTIIVVDCGLAFPGDDMLGIDLVIPDVTYLKNNIDKVKGFVITHGHEDHIGALPYILEQINVPVYATKLTMALIEHKLKERNMMRNTKRKVVKHGQSVNLGCFRVEYVKTNHSIQDAAALAIYTPVGTVLHTGDFKIDYTPVFGDPIDLQRFAELGKKGVLALMADSTNAIRPGFTMSERTVGKTFDAIFAEHKNNRIIVATFASNVDRVQQIVNTAHKYGRKVVVEGRSMVTVMEIARELNYINVPEGTLIEIEQLRNYPPESTVIISTGSQGESMAALSRMAASLHKKVTITPSDVVVLSSTPIPGNEKAVANVVNELSMKGATVINQDTHVSGHACQEDLKLIYSLVHPKYAIPIHGEHRHRMAQKELAQFMGVEKDNAVIINSGDVLALSEDSCEVIDHVPAGGIFVDGLGVGDVGNIVLRDRQNLAQNGIIVVVLTLEKRSNQLLAGPDIVSRGFVYVRESEDLLEEAHSVVVDAVDDCLNRHVSDWGKIKNVIKDSLSDFLWKRMKRSPMILPIIMEV
ncbi:MAG: RNase J family beta-CASP ribonuclease [Clostridium sp.]|nr:RNase J family beta-CASP ribonuclease [Clostridium sp.]